MEWLENGHIYLPVQGIFNLKRKSGQDIYYTHIPQRTHPQYIKNTYKSVRKRQTIQFKMDKRFEQAFHKRGYLNNEHAYERVLAVIISDTHWGTTTPLLKLLKFLKPCQYQVLVRIWSNWNPHTDGSINWNNAGNLFACNYWNQTYICPVTQQFNPGCIPKSKRCSVHQKTWPRFLILMLFQHTSGWMRSGSPSATHCAQKWPHTLPAHPRQQYEP